MSLELFPGAIPVEEYVRRTYDACAPHGLVSGATLAMVGLCRDELSDALAEPIRAAWGSPFRMGGLAGMLFLGQAGLRAGEGHAPDADGRRRYVVYLMPHIGVDDEGRAGYIHRPGQGAATTACGALMGFRGQLASGSVPDGIDPHDPEMSLLRQRLVRAVPSGDAPDIVELTTIVRDVILEDFEATAARLDSLRDADVAVFSGIHIHTSQGDHVQPGPASIRRAGGGQDALEL